jgi:hypothetical protein
MGGKPSICEHRITAGMDVELITSGCSRVRILVLDPTPAADRDCCTIIC